MADQEARERGEPDVEETRQGGDSEEMQAARRAEEKHESAKETMKELEERDEPPTKLEDWPDDEAKYVTYGGAEGDHSYAEGPEAKLGPSDLERKAGGGVAIEGDDVENPDDYKGDPIPGGPTDPDAPKLPGERKKREKMEEMGTLPEGSDESSSSDEGEDRDGNQDDRERSG